MTSEQNGLVEVSLDRTRLAAYAAAQAYVFAGLGDTVCAEAARMFQQALDGLPPNAKAVSREQQGVLGVQIVTKVASQMDQGATRSALGFINQLIKPSGVRVVCRPDGIFKAVMPDQASKPAQPAPDSGGRPADIPPHVQGVAAWTGSVASEPTNFFGPSEPPDSLSLLAGQEPEGHLGVMDSSPAVIVTPDMIVAAQESPYIHPFGVQKKEPRGPGKRLEIPIWPCPLMDLGKLGHAVLIRAVRATMGDTPNYNGHRPMEAFLAHLNEIQPGLGEEVYLTMATHLKPVAEAVGESIRANGPCLTVLYERDFRLGISQRKVAAAGMANPRVQEVLQAMGFPTINMAMARFAREPGLAQETLTHLSARSGRQNPRLQHLAREDIAETVRFVIAAQGYSYLDATQPERVGQVPSHSMTAVTQACSRPDMLVASPVYSNDKEARDLVERLPQILDTKSAAMHIARVRQRRAQQLGQFAQIVGDRIFLQLYEAKFTLDASKCAAGGNSETDRDIVSDVAFTSFTVMNALNVWACNSCSPQHAITQFGPALLHDRGCVLVQCDMPIVDNSMGRKEPLFGLDPALVRRGSFSYKVMPLDPHTVALALGNTDLRILQRIAAIQEAENRVIPDDELFLAA